MQRAEIALKYDKLYRKVARDRWASTKFTSESGQEAINKRWDDDNITSEIRPPSADGSGSHVSSTSQQLAEQFGVSSSTLERVRRGNKENNGSNSGAGADADDDNITRHRSFQATN